MGAVNELQGFEKIVVAGRAFMSLMDAAAITRLDYHSLLRASQRGNPELIRNPGGRPKWLVLVSDVEQIVLRRRRNALVEHSPPPAAPRG